MGAALQGYKTPLQRERKVRGWKQQRVVDDLKRIAHDLGYGTTLDGFDVSALSRYENGRLGRPRDPLPEVFAKLYGKRVEELFPERQPPMDGILQVGSQGNVLTLEVALEVFTRIWSTLETLAPLGNVDPDMLRRQFLQLLVSAGGSAASAALYPLGQDRPAAWPLMRAWDRDTTVQAVTLVTGQYRRLEATTAARELLGPVRAHLGFISRLLDTESHGENTQLAASASEAAGFAAWLSFDRNDHAAARRHYQSAVGYAEQAGSNLLQAYMLGSMSLWAAALDNGKEAVDLIGRARLLIPADAPPAPRAWAGTVAAIAYASKRDAGASLAALGQAERAIEHGPRDAEPLWPWVYPFDEAKIAVYRSACAAKLQLPKAGLPASTKALAGLGAAPTKQRALALCDQAILYALVDELDEACRLAAEAHTIGVKTHSRKIVSRVQEVRAHPALRKHAAAVRVLDEHIRGTNVPRS